jgi:hypothetical protein
MFFPSEWSDTQQFLALNAMFLGKMMRNQRILGLPYDTQKTSKPSQIPPATPSCFLRRTPFATCGHSHYPDVPLA